MRSPRTVHQWRRSDPPESALRPRHRDGVVGCESGFFGHVAKKLLAMIARHDEDGSFPPLSCMHIPRDAADLCLDRDHRLAGQRAPPPQAAIWRLSWALGLDDPEPQRTVLPALCEFMRAAPGLGRKPGCLHSRAPAPAHRPGGRSHRRDARTHHPRRRGPDRRVHPAPTGDRLRNHRSVGSNRIDRQANLAAGQ